MKILTQFIRSQKNEDGKTEWVFEIEYSQKIEKKQYLMELSEVKSKRSVEQNKYMWALIHEITEAMNDNDDFNTYTLALEQANVKYEWVMGLPQIENELKKSFRAVKLTRYEDYKGKQMAIFKCYAGSSKFTKEEMSRLIEVLLQMAASCGVDTRVYETVLGG